MKTNFLVLLFLFAAACHPQTPAAATNNATVPPTRESLLGTWTWTSDEGFVRFTFNADGSFVLDNAGGNTRVGKFSVVVGVVTLDFEGEVLAQHSEWPFYVSGDGQHLAMQAFLADGVHDDVVGTWRSSTVWNTTQWTENDVYEVRLGQGGIADMSDAMTYNGKTEIHPYHGTYGATSSTTYALTVAPNTAPYVMHFLDGKVITIDGGDPFSGDVIPYFFTRVN
jgi:hypothetical protein